MASTVEKSDDTAEVARRTFYRRALTALIEGQIPFLVGGAAGLEMYVGLTRDTKDFDVFIRPADVNPALQVLTAAGFETEVRFPHWIAKAISGGNYLDLIYNSGNGLCRVDESWFEHARDREIFGLPMKVCPAEEMIWQKAFVMSRERFDGADIAHLLRACAESLDWTRLLKRFGHYWEVLYTHLVLFTFIYPDERGRLPAWVMGELAARLQGNLAAPPDNPPEKTVCQGTHLSVIDFQVDLDDFGYADARLRPHGTMQPEDLERWVGAFRNP